MGYQSLMPVIGAVCVACGCGASGGVGDPAQPDPDPSAAIRMLAGFDGDHPTVDPLSGRWRVVNDNIMGGRSDGGGVIRDGVMVFSGSTNTDGGGFSSIRAGEKRWDLGGFDGLAARVRADGRRYVFHIDTGLRVGGGTVFYRGSFETEALLGAAVKTDPEEVAWQEVFVPFEEFVPMIRGRDVSGRVGPLDPAAVRSIGLMIDDGLDGPFRLEVDWMKAVRPVPVGRATGDGG